MRSLPRLQRILTFGFLVIVLSLQILVAIFAFITFSVPELRNNIPLMVIATMIEIGVISTATYGIGKLFVTKALEPTQRMLTNLDQFTIDASHELKTPLSKINLALDLAIKTGKVSYIHDAKKYVSQSDKLITRLLELARLDKLSLSKEKIDTHAFLRETFKSMFHAHEKRLVIQGENITILADKELLQTVVLNVIENALKYGKDESKIIVSVHQKYITFSNELMTPIPNEELERLFERFYQSGRLRNHKGYGVGLAIVEKICSIHGWSIKAIQEGNKINFTIRFR
jgi:signal transduction histidine kinase